MAVDGVLIHRLSHKAHSFLRLTEVSFPDPCQPWQSGGWNIHPLELSEPSVYLHDPITSLCVYVLAMLLILAVNSFNMIFGFFVLFCLRQDFTM